MDQTLTMNEIKERFDSEWVLVGAPEWDADGQFVRGTILFHSKSRDEVDEQDMALAPVSAAIIFTGELPEDAAVVL
ncbi:MAG: hypothetical protein C4547_09780 [Phycisphaerales bacterium]|nr:MAG: hypothetical protein C4547_09780 [Phycisphaerales bacterium]